MAIENVTREEGLVVQDAPQAKASRLRWWILVLLFTITVINFIDRQTLSVLAPAIRAAFHLSNTQYGRIVSALQFGLMSGELPMGWFMDRWGVRLGLSCAVLWWSAATASQVFGKSGLQLGLSRYWMGTGECGNYSAGMKAVTSIFPAKERTFAIGIFNGGSMIGATLAPPFIVYLTLHYGFRAAFLVPALLGVLWIPLWVWLYRDKRHGQTQGSERATKLTSLLGDSSSWAVMMCRFFIGPVAQFYWYWVPSYFASVWHFSLTQIGFMAWIPFMLGDIGGIAGGLAAGWLHNRNVSSYNVRRITMYASGLLCVASACVPFTPKVSIAILIIGIAIFADNFLAANMYGAISDLFPTEKVGRVTGLTGVAGGLSGLIFPLVTGRLVDHYSYTPVFLIVAVMPLVGVVALFVLARAYRAKGGMKQAPEASEL